MVTHATGRQEAQSEGSEDHFASLAIDPGGCGTRLQAARAGAPRE